jgi:hypothetical protein
MLPWARHEIRANTKSTSKPFHPLTRIKRQTLGKKVKTLIKDDKKN